MKKIELLAPVGSYEALLAAVQNGADAVYLSGPNFGARKFAKNFDREEMIEAIAYAHIRNVKVYVTVNTLIKDSEWEDVLTYVDFLYLHDVDAIIVQDMGLGLYLLKNYPDLDVHASTQMSAHGVYDVQKLSDLGFKRVVLAREMTLEEIEVVAKTVAIETEVFVHGALCVSYSGQCLMSSVIGGRSGNRGRCAQPCRQLYTMDETTNFALSPKDLKSLENVQKLISAGVTSLKIEGRMKGPEYAATVVNAYKNAIDGNPDDALLNRVFNRGYTKGFLFHDTSIIGNDAPGNKGEYIGTVHAYDDKNELLTLKLEKMIHKGDEIQIRRDNTSVGARTDVFYLEGIRTKKIKMDDLVSVDFKYKAFPGEKIYRTYDAEVMDNAKHSYLKEFRKSKVNAFVRINEGQRVYLSMTDDRGHKVEAMSEEVVEKAINMALTEDRVITQLNKLGQTAYELDHCEIDLEAGVSISVKALNDARRICTDALDDLRKQFYTRSSCINKDVYEKSHKKVMPELAVGVRNKGQLEALANFDIKTIYYPASNEIIEGLIPRLFRITPDEDNAMYESKLKNYHGPLLIGNIGQIDLFKHLECIGDYSLNNLNSNTINGYETLGLRRLTVSYEMSKNELRNLRTDAALEMIVYGRVPVMVTAYCPITQMNMHCDHCAKACENNKVLIDRFDDVYPMMRTNHRLEIMSQKTLHLLSILEDLLPGPIDVLRLEFTTETPEEVKRITHAYLRKIHGEKVDLQLDQVTKSHYFDGVE